MRRDSGSETRGSASRPSAWKVWALGGAIALLCLVAVVVGIRRETSRPASPPRNVYGTFSNIADQRTAPAAVQQMLEFVPPYATFSFTEVAEAMGGGLDSYVGSNRLPGTFIVAPGPNGSSIVTWELPCEGKALRTDARGIAIIKVRVAAGGTGLAPLNDNAQAIVENQS